MTIQPRIFHCVQDDGNITFIVFAAQDDKTLPYSFHSSRWHGLVCGMAEAVPYQDGLRSNLLAQVGKYIEAGALPHLMA